MTPEEFGNCHYCGQGVMHNGIPIFYRLTIETHGINVHKTQQQVGLEMMLGGNAVIAAALGDRDITEQLGMSTVTACHSCVMERMDLLSLIGDGEADQEC